MLEPGIPVAREFGLEGDCLLVVPAAGQVLYRLVGQSDPKERDFQSDRDKERPRWPDQSYVDYLGLSMYETEDLAKENAIRYPKLIASVRLGSDRGFTLARTELDLEGHYSVWGEPKELVEAVQTVERHDENA